MKKYIDSNKYHWYLVLVSLVLVVVNEYGWVLVELVFEKDNQNQQIDYYYYYYYTYRMMDVVVY